jgi:glycosyltransferase involved in cell wall biosynthesis
MQKLLMLGVTHTARSPRLLYRQVFKLAKHGLNVRAVYAGRSSFLRDYREHHLLPIVRPPRIPETPPRGRKWFATLRLALKSEPDWVQASDVRELAMGLLICVVTRARLIYDAHEDYFNQSYEYSGRLAKGWLKGKFLRYQEILLARFSTGVFCTDEYLYRLYKQKRFGLKNVHLLRNFTNVDLVEHHASAPLDNGVLRLVYIGGVNRFRGIVECAEFVRRLNQEKGFESVALDVYAHENDLVRQLRSSGLIRHRGHLAPDDMLKRLSEYHVGLCIWRRLVKFQRNLPMKNFDYMAVGLPVLTSDFDNLRKQVGCAGLFVDPGHYGDFRQAIEIFRISARWKEMSDEGLRITRERCNLDREIDEYLNIFRC